MGDKRAIPCQARGLWRLATAGDARMQPPDRSLGGPGFDARLTVREVDCKAPEQASERGVEVCRSPRRGSKGANSPPKRAVRDMKAQFSGIRRIMTGASALAAS